MKSNERAGARQAPALSGRDGNSPPRRSARMLREEHHARRRRPASGGIPTVRSRMLRWSVGQTAARRCGCSCRYGDMSDADIVAILSCLRAQPAVSHRVPSSRVVDHRQGGQELRAGVSAADRDRIRRRSRPAGVDGGARCVSRAIGGQLRGVSHGTRPVSFAAIRPEFARRERDGAVRARGVDRKVWFRTPTSRRRRGQRPQQVSDRDTFIARDSSEAGVSIRGSPMPWRHSGR